MKKVHSFLSKNYPDLKISATLDSAGRKIVTLTGECGSWEQVVEIGHKVARLEGVDNVVNDLTVEGMDLPRKDYGPYIERGMESGMLGEADMVIIGLGITGCAIARALSKYKLKVIAIDMGEDVATGATKANNGGVHHAGGVKPGTLKAKLSVRGNRMYDDWARELGFELKRCGDLLIVEDPVYEEELKAEYLVAALNGDVFPQLINGEQAMQIEPKLADYGVVPTLALWLPSQARIHPYEVAVALIENAAQNGVKVIFDCTACAIETKEGQVSGVLTDKGLIRTQYVINAAGVYADEISQMAGDRCFTIHGRKGTIAIMDQSKAPMYDHQTGHFISASVQHRNADSKGGGMEFTPAGNILIGPSATEVPNKEDVETTAEELDFIMRINENPAISKSDIIRIYAGIRPADYSEDYVIGMSPITHGFVNVGAIQSPGLGASPAVAEMVEQIILEDASKMGFPMEPKENFNPIRKKKVKFRELSREDQDKLVSLRPEYGHVICRCETITEGEILDAIQSPVVPTSIDAIKRRTRAGMGRCQGGFCQPRVLEILARELGIDWVEVNLNKKGSNVLKRDNRSTELHSKDKRGE